MSWVVTASLARLLADFRATFPAKDRESDGTIGDAAHQAETSGHNPDDTPGSRAEYSDADSKAEVRAIDVDNDLRDPHGVTMEQVVQRLLATPGDRDRLMYVIYNRRIWRKRNSWRQEPYTGSSPHTEHAHFSGDPDHDEDASPWSSVLSFKGDDMALSDIIAGTGSIGTGGKDRSVAQILGDLANFRAVLIGEKTAAQAGYGGSTPLAQLLTLASAGPEHIDVAALAAALAPLIDAQVDSTVSEAAVRQALEQVLPNVRLAVPEIHSLES